jgi:hypothetical protein
MYGGTVARTISPAMRLCQGTSVAPSLLPFGEFMKASTVYTPPSFLAAVWISPGWLRIYHVALAIGQSNAASEKLGRYALNPLSPKTDRILGKERQSRLKILPVALRNRGSLVLR